MRATFLDEREAVNKLGMKLLLALAVSESVLMLFVTKVSLKDPKGGI